MKSLGFRKSLILSSAVILIQMLPASGSKFNPDITEDGRYDPGRNAGPRADGAREQAKVAYYEKQKPKKPKNKPKGAKKGHK